MAKTNNYLKPAFWKRLLNFWTVLSFFVIVADFWVDGVFSMALTPILIIYVAVLSAFGADKEFRRWHDYHSGRHPGEIYVILWTVLIVALFVADLLLSKGYSMPDAVVSTYIVALGILAITRTSKALHEEEDENTSN